MVRHWDLETGEELRVFPAGARVRSVMFSPDGQWAACGTDEGMFYVWDLISGESLVTQHDGDRVVHSVTFMRDGRQLIVAGGGHAKPDDHQAFVRGNDYAIRAYTLPQWRDLVPLVDTDNIDEEAWKRTDEGLVVSGFPSEGSLSLPAQVNGGYQLHVEFTRHKGAEVMVLLPVGSRHALLVFDRIETHPARWKGPQPPEVTLENDHRYRLKIDVALNDGRVAIKADLDNERQIDWEGSMYELTLPKQLLFEMQPNAISLGAYRSQVTFHSARLLSQQDAQTLPPPGPQGADEIELVGRIPGHPRPVTSVAWSPDGHSVVTAGYARQLYFWNCATWEKLPVPNVTERAHSALAFSPDSKVVVNGCSDGPVLLWDVEKREILPELSVQHDSRVTDVEFTPDGRFLLTVSHDGTLRRWNVATGEELEVMHAEKEITSLSILPGGKTVLTGGQESMQLWDLESGSRLREFPLKGRITSMDVTADGARAVTGERNGYVRVWNLEKGFAEQTIRLEGLVTSVVVTDDGKHAIAGGHGQRLIVLKLATGEIVAERRISSHCINHLAISPDGKQIVSGGGLYLENDELQYDGDYDLRLWRMPESLYPEEQQTQSEEES